MRFRRFLMSRAQRASSVSLAAALALAAACGAGKEDQGDSRPLNEATLPGGTAIKVDIATPADGAVFPGGVAVNVTGTAEIGVGLPIADTALVYVVDVSGSTVSTVMPGCGGDENLDTLV